jgi:hypothetical protein
MTEGFLEKAACVAAFFIARFPRACLTEGMFSEKTHLSLGRGRILVLS